jgi:pimeloyl-ACP methyl ester carboxylesterase
MTIDGTATRRHPVSGIIEEIEFFGETPRMLGSIHLPAGVVKGAVVMCSSTHAELLKAYHLEVLVARALAERGIAVHRFQYRGDGNSEGTDTDLTLPSMIAAGREVRERLEQRTGIDRVGYMAVRLGAYPAAALAEEEPATGMLLWDPVPDTDAFIRDAVRSHAIAALKSESKPDSLKRVLERFEEEDAVELLGYQISSAFHSSIAGKKLTDFTPRAARVMIVPFGSLDMGPIVDGWSSSGIEVTSLDRTGSEPWWLAEQVSQDRDLASRTLAGNSADWLAAAIEGA